MEELQGVVKGLVEVTKTNVKAQKDLSDDTAKQLHTLTEAAAELSNHVAPKSSIGATLRLPPVSLPTYSGAPTDSLDGFLDQFIQIIESSGIHPRHWNQYLKQQVQQDLSAFDIVTQAEVEHRKHLGTDPSKAAEPEYITSKQWLKLLKRSVVNPKISKSVTYSQIITLWSKATQKSMRFCPSLPWYPNRTVVTHSKNSSHTGRQRHWIIFQLLVNYLINMAVYVAWYLSAHFCPFMEG